MVGYNTPPPWSVHDCPCCRNRDYSERNCPECLARRAPPSFACARCGSPLTFHPGYQDHGERPGTHGGFYRQPRWVPGTWSCEACPAKAAETERQIQERRHAAAKQLAERRKFRQHFWTIMVFLGAWIGLSNLLKWLAPIPYTRFMDAVLRHVEALF